MKAFLVATLASSVVFAEVNGPPDDRSDRKLDSFDQSQVRRELHQQGSRGKIMAAKPIHDTSVSRKTAGSVGQPPSSDKAVAPNNNWRVSPVIVGGTQGSGTRGVEDILVKLGVYMHPARHTRLFKTCYNGDPLDNMCMRPRGGNGLWKNKTGFNDAGTLYYDWLYDKECLAIKFRPPQNLSENGEAFLASVPQINRQPLRWGWKLPETMFQLNRLLSYFPGMVFLHVLRNPLDMANSYLEHLPAVSSEFGLLHGGAASAADLIRKRCESILKTLPERRAMEKCAVVPEKFRIMSNFSWCFGHGTRCMPKATPSSAWSCLHAMLWAEVNPAVRAFGDQCLRPAGRYMYYHAEDGYALRGEKNRTHLAVHLAGMLRMPRWKAMKAYEENAHGKHHRRRLSYGKFRDPTSELDIHLTVQCAQAANPLALTSLGYGEDLVL